MQKRTLKPPKNSTCSFLTISEQEVKKVLKELGTKKSVEVDTIPPKLVKYLLSCILLGWTSLTVY